MDNKKYFAFISYKREDSRWAEWLQKKIEHYRFPSNLNGRTDLPKEIRPTFRDVTDLNPGVLAEEINKALKDSIWLIVVCSPRSAQSKWVCKEAQTFIDLGRADHIIPFIIEGTPFSEEQNAECYPEALLKLPTSQELLAANINEMGRDAAAIKVVARMFGLRFDNLWQRHERELRKKRIRTYILSGLIAIVGIVVGSVFMVLNQRISRMSKEVQNKNELLMAANDSIETAYLRLSEAKDTILERNAQLSNSRDSIVATNHHLSEANDRIRSYNHQLLLSNIQVLAESSLESINDGQFTTSRDRLKRMCQLSDDKEILTTTPGAEKALRTYWQQKQEVVNPLYYFTTNDTPEILSFSTDETRFFVFSHNELQQYRYSDGFWEKTLYSVERDANNFHLDRPYSYAVGFNSETGTLVYSINDNLLLVKNIYTGANIIPPIYMPGSDSEGKYDEWSAELDIVTNNSCNTIAYSADIIDYQQDTLSRIHKSYLLSLQNNATQELPSSISNIIDISEDGTLLIVRYEDEDGEGHYGLFDSLNNAIEIIQYQDVQGASITTYTFIADDNIVAIHERNNPTRKDCLNLYDIRSKSLLKLSHPIVFSEKGDENPMFSPNINWLITDAYDYELNNSFLQIYDCTELALYAIHLYAAKIMDYTGEILEKDYVFNLQKTKYIFNLPRPRETYLGWHLNTVSPSGSKLLLSCGKKILACDISYRNVLLSDNSYLTSNKSYISPGGLFYCIPRGNKTYELKSFNNKDESTDLGVFQGYRPLFISRKGNIMVFEEGDYYIEVFNRDIQQSFYIEKQIKQEPKIFSDREGNIFAISNHNIRIFDSKSQQLLMEIPPAMSFSCAFYISPCGDFFAYSPDFEHIELYSIFEKKSLGFLTAPGKNHYFSSLKISPDGKYLAATDSGQTIYIWELDSRKIKSTILTSQWGYEVDDISISPDNEYLITSNYHCSCVWNLQTCNPVLELDNECKFAEEIPNLIISGRDYLAFPNLTDIIHSLH